MIITFCPSSVTQVVETAPLRASSVRVNSWSLGMYTSPLANASKIEFGDLAGTDVLVTRSRPLDPSSVQSLVGDPKKCRVGGGLLLFHLLHLLQLLEERHGGLVGQVHLDLHPVVLNVKVVRQGLKETPLCQELRIHGWLGCCCCCL